MRTARDQKRINVAKKQSAQAVVQDQDNREFFRFEGNRLIEYDLTKYRGKDVRLNDKEKAGLEDFPPASL